MRAAVLTRGDWLVRAACREYDPEWWALTAGKMGSDNLTAQEICLGCPVIRDCAAHTSDIDEGVIRAAAPIRSRHDALALRRRFGVTGWTVAAPPPEPATPARRGLQPCGTPAAYQRHRDHRETPCADCKAAHARRVSAYKAAANEPEEG